MTTADVKARLAEIRAKADDDEWAHLAEDDLHQEVLKYIASNAPDEFAALAREALKSTGIDFARWCT